MRKYINNVLRISISPKSRVKKKTALLFFSNLKIVVELYEPKILS